MIDADKDIPEAKRQEDEDKKRSRKRILILFGIAAALVIILVIIMLLLSFCSKKTEAPVEEAVITETEEEPPGEMMVEEESGEELTEDEEEPEPSEDEEEPGEEEDPLPEEEEDEAVAPTVSIAVYDGPNYSPQDDVCYYRIEASVTGDPYPGLEWSHHDDSEGAFGSRKIQINLNDPSETVNLVATATNSAGSSSDSLVLSWSCNRPPAIEDIALSGDSGINKACSVSAAVSDPDGDTLTYSWSVSGGSIANPSANPASWNTPSSPGSYSVTVTVNDGKGGTDSRTESFNIEGNRPPELAEIVIKNSPGGDTADKIIVNYDYTLHISASDPDGDSLNYYWEVTAGTLGNAYSNPASWQAPYYPGFVDIKVTVDDGNGESVIRTRRVEVGYYVN